MKNTIDILLLDKPKQVKKDDGNYQKKHFYSKGCGKAF